MKSLQVQRGDLEFPGSVEAAVAVMRLQDPVGTVLIPEADGGGPAPGARLSIGPPGRFSRPVGAKTVSCALTCSVWTLLRLSRRESWWKDAEILMLRHRLAVAEHGRPKARTRLTWPDRAWLALLAGTVPEAATSERSR
jgi:hypothetical protein